GERLGQPDCDRQKPRESRDLLDPHAGLVLNVGEERNEPPEWRYVSLGCFDVEDLRSTDGSRWIGEVRRREAPAPPLGLVQAHVDAVAADPAALWVGGAPG